MKSIATYALIFFGFIISILASVMAMLRFWLSSSQKCPEEQLLKSRDMNVAQLRSKFSLSLLEGQGLSTSGHTHYGQNLKILAKNDFFFDQDTFFLFFFSPSRFFLHFWISDMRYEFYLHINYRIIASTRLSRLVAHSRIFRLFKKGKFDAYVL